MKIAAPSWQTRISPVFDSARSFLVVECGGTYEKASMDFEVRSDEQNERIQMLEHLGVEVLICGAISRDAEIRLSSLKIQVISGVSGDVREVIRAFCKNRLDGDEYFLATCPRRKRRCRGRKNRGTLSGENQ